ncbi:hypothetical protein ACIBHY_39755 [Nonomuraea sp. NPDC050547]|uniref:hypothetical protein n=1 Tax=Nonomuraea sp. NPDC050547 TaxID=3364368 RepID=UPI0037AC7180
MHGELTTLGTKVAPSTVWEVLKRVAQAVRNLVMDLEDTGCRARYLIRDRDGEVPGAHGRDPRRGRHSDRAHRHPDAADERDHGTVGPAVANYSTAVCCGTNATCGTLCTSTNSFTTGTAPIKPLAQAAPLRPVPDTIIDQERIASLTIRRRDRLGGILHAYSHAA